MKIAVAVPVHDKPHSETMSSLLGLQALSLSRGRDVTMVRTGSSIVGNARNVAVHAAKQLGATHLLQIDSDMIFPPWLLEEYLRADVDIIGTPYRRRGPPWGMMGEMEPDQDLVGASKQCRPVKFKWLATGLMMVKMEVYDKMSEPYYRHPIEDGKVKGEDMEFCRQVKELGYDIHGLLHLPRVGHILTAVLWNDELNIMPVEMYDQKKLMEAKAQEAQDEERRES